MCARYERTHLGVFIEPGADDDLFAGGNQTMEEISAQAPVEEQPGSGTANLPLTRKDAEKSILQRHIRIGIGENDIWTLSSQLE